MTYAGDSDAAGMHTIGSALPRSFLYPDVFDDANDGVPGVVVGICRPKPLVDRVLAKEHKIGRGAADGHVTQALFPVR